MIPREDAIEALQSDRFDLAGGVAEDASQALTRELGWTSQRVSAELERSAQDAAAEGICAK